MRVLTSPAETGAVVLALPQDVQAEAYSFPEELFEKRVWLLRRPAADRPSFERAADAIRASRSPLIIAGGGVMYSEAAQALALFAQQTGIPVAETQAGKGSLPYDHPQCVGAVGATGNLAANRLAREADLVIGIGTRYTDFTTASTTLFENPEVTFVNINVAEFDAYKRSAIPLIADAHLTLEELSEALHGYHVPEEYTGLIARLETGLGNGSGAPVPPGQPAPARPERADRGDLGSRRAARRDPLGRRQPSGRPA